MGGLVDAGLMTLFTIPALYGLVFCPLREHFAERQRAQSALLESEQRLRVITETAGDAIISIDSRHHIVLWNRAAEGMFGYTAAEAMGQPLALIIPERFQQKHHGAIGRLTGRAETKLAGRPIELMARRKGGEEFPAELSVATWKTENAVFFTGILRDITERKRTEAALHETQRELLLSSRLAGMAEVATSVLHNVGNVLNSINVSANLIAERVRGSRVKNLARAAELIRSHATNLDVFLSKDPKGRQLPEYLTQVVDQLVRDQGAMLGEVRSLVEGVNHVRDIVTMQQNHAKAAGVTELVQPTDLVEEALRIEASSLVRPDLQIVRDYQVQLPEINVDRHKVLQILINLIRNARHACEESQQADKRLTLRVWNGEGRVKIAVADNGIGVPPENLARIFNHGFTTRKDGHGFGLHSSALAASGMGGAIHVQSEGPGRGATFTLELPAPAASVPAELPTRTTSVQAAA
jgi:PAS domain S-box-containing protein